MPDNNGLRTEIASADVGKAVRLWRNFVVISLFIVESDKTDVYEKSFLLFVLNGVCGDCFARRFVGV